MGEGVVESIEDFVVLGLGEVAFEGGVEGREMFGGLGVYWGGHVLMIIFVYNGFE